MSELNTDLIDAIKRLSIPNTFPDGSPYTGISVEHIVTLSKRFEIIGKNIEITSLENGIIPIRYVRNMKTFSLQEQITLLKSTVTVAGLGGLGGGVTEILARIGIGTLSLIDGDMFEDSNLNRQFLSTQPGLFTSKAEAAARRVAEINSSISVRKYVEFLNDENAVTLLRGSHVVVDCLDSLKTRFILEKFSKQLGVPFVSAAIAGVSGHVMTVFPNDAGLKLIYGDPCDLTARGAERHLGCLSHAVTLLSSLECSEVIKILLRRGKLLRNRMIVIDLMDNTLETMQLK